MSACEPFVRNGFDASSAPAAYSPRMIHDIAPDVYRAIREYGDLSPEELADALGLKRQVVHRWENAKQESLPKRAQEKILVDETKLTPLAFTEILCEVLTDFSGRQVTMAPSADYVPSLPLVRAVKQYSRHRDKLDPGTRGRIEEMLLLGRTADANAEQVCSFFAREILRLIEEALAAKGESPSDN